MSEHHHHHDHDHDHTHRILPSSEEEKQQMYFAMRLSLGIGVLMLVMKVTAWWLTKSAAILSDAAESVVHVVAVGFAAYSMRLSYKPADRTHAYGHAKIGFFSAGVEGGMILLAAIFIIFESVGKIIEGPTMENLGLGTVLTVAAVLINGILGFWLLRLGKKRHSLILEANGQHVLTDCWTSIGVVLALGLIFLTRWNYWDPIFGLLMGANIFITAVKLMRRSVGGLMDEVELAQEESVQSALDKIVSAKGMTYHELKVRPMGDRQAVEFHLLLKDNLPLIEAHQIATEVETELKSTIEPPPYVTTHLEPLSSSHEKQHH